MARKRMIDPSIWSDDGMAQLTPRQQLLYIGLISNADDAGRLKGSPVALRLACPTIYYGAPDDDEIVDDLNAVMDTMNQLIMYVVDGKPYLVFTNYLTWQKIDKPQPSKLPEPPVDAENRVCEERSPNVPRMVAPNRIEKNRSKEKRREENIAPQAPREKSRDLHFEIVAECWMGRPYQDITLTPSQQGTVGKAASELKRINAPPERIPVEWLRISKQFDNITPHALAKHWDATGNIPAPALDDIKDPFMRSLLRLGAEHADTATDIHSQNGRIDQHVTQTQRLGPGDRPDGSHLPAVTRRAG